MNPGNELKAVAAPESDGQACLAIQRRQNLASRVSDLQRRIQSRRSIDVYRYYESSEPPQEAAAGLAQSLWILNRHRWSILAFVAICVAGTLAVSFRLTPIYESTASIEIDRETPAGILGPDTNARSIDYTADQVLSTQVRVIQSDSVLRPVVQRFHLRTAAVDPSKSPVPNVRVEAAPISLPDLKVTRPANTYLLLISYRSPNPELAADVANGVAQSYIEHTYNTRFKAASGLSDFMSKQLESLKAKMEQSSATLAKFEKDLNVINPEEKTSILSARLLQLNTELTNAQSDRVRQQAAFDSVKNGSAEAAQASQQGEQLRKLDDRLDEAREKFASIKAQYGATHPEYKKVTSQLAELERQRDALQVTIAKRVGLGYEEALNREAMLRGAVADAKAEFDRLNARSFEYRTLKQEAETDKNLYQELHRKIKEAGINASFQNSFIRLADPARPGLKPAFPNIPLNGGLAFFLSTFLAIGVVIVADLFDNTLRDPEQVRRGLRTEVLGSLPSVKSWHGWFPISSKTRKYRVAVQLSSRKGSQTAIFDQAISTLWESILACDPRRRPRSLLLTSAVSREGKTTTSVHLAAVLSLQNRKTLLIDADLRCPAVHEHFGFPNDRGLSTVVNGEADWRTVLQTAEEYPYLDVLTGGPPSRQVTERLGVTLEALLTEAEREYDLVIVDSPPVGGFAESLQMSMIVDGVVVVVKSGQTNRTAALNAVLSLKRANATILGVALNQVHQNTPEQYYYAYRSATPLE